VVLRQGLEGGAADKAAPLLPEWGILVQETAKYLHCGGVVQARGLGAAVVAPLYRCLEAGLLGKVPGGDRHDTAKGVGAVEAGGRTQNDFHLLDAFEWKIVAEGKVPVVEMAHLDPVHQQHQLVVVAVQQPPGPDRFVTLAVLVGLDARSEEHTSELQSRENLVCRL